VYEQLPAGFEEFAASIAERGREISLGHTLLKLACPGVPDLYQGDERESLNVVDPDNRRSLDWSRRESPKSELVRRVLALRRENPAAFAGSYEPLDLGPDVCAFVRGALVKVVVPLRPGAPEPEISLIRSSPHTVRQ
jgi:(1->4)-alpha-D-glucan 1-alpha-D-glucosylmutase